MDNPVAFFAIMPCYIQSPQLAKTSVAQGGAKDLCYGLLLEPVGPLGPEYPGQ